MNSRQLQYAIMLAKDLNFSQVAEKLNISQPALSKQILSLESELGVKLFDRSTSPMTLTAAGECFINDAREILFREDQLKRKMEEYSSGEKGRLIIGVSPFRSFWLLPEIVKKLKEKFDGLKIIIRELSSGPLHDGAINGEFDFAIINLPVDRSKLDVYPMQEEPVILACHKDIAKNIPGSYPEDSSLPEVDLTECADIPFVLLTKKQELRRLFDEIATSEGLDAKDITEVVSITTAWAMVNEGVGATILPMKFAEEGRTGSDIEFFALKHDTPVRRPVVVTKKGQHISKYAEYAINLLTQK